MQRIYSSHWADYELIDAGNNKKLERWGNTITIRPERNAYFTPILSQNDWNKKADFEFIEETSNSGYWKILNKKAKKNWQIEFKNCVFNLQLTKFKHIGIFPEQKTNWDYLISNLNKDDKFLNLFAHTGGSSLVANSIGANVNHCDSVKQIISWARENMESSNLNDISWILEDALKFSKREEKRGNKYDAIIMDPPAYGIGAKKERWKIETLFPELVKTSSQILNKTGFLIVNTYSPKLGEEEIKETVIKYFPSKKIEINKLCIKSTTGKIIEYGELTKVF
ncbi:methyltransferase [Vicingus serpentipes]|uniref:Methyltransferase n=1 Tax=Vicingus serpentipes TaxID=1926625 RepID=A0A5C6RSI6_9FLAO|nr:class I SAM-dependent methyltransferase [Vicingus serpentipes]TXB65228.1 methyltransferase [Vicingus serpentipes]